MKLSLIGDYSRGTDTTVQGVVTSLNTVSYPTGAVSTNTAFGNALSPVVPSAENREVNNNVDTRAEERNYGLSAQLDWRLAGGQTLSSITAWRGWDNTPVPGSGSPRGPDCDLAPAGRQGGSELQPGFAGIPADFGQGQFPRVCRGSLLSARRPDETYRRDITAASVGHVGYGEAQYSTRSDDYAIFGEATLNVTDRLRGIAGLRWTQDELSYTHQRVRNPAAVALPGVGATQGEVSGSTSARSSRAGSGRSSTSRRTSRPMRPIRVATRSRPSTSSSICRWARHAGAQTRDFGFV